MKTNDPAALSCAQALLQAEDIECFLFDTSMAVTEGSLGILPRRLLVRAHDARRARAVLHANGLPIIEPEPRA